MTKSSDANADETPIQRALRLKRAAQAANGKGGGGFNRKATAAMPTGASRPRTRK